MNPRIFKHTTRIVAAAALIAIILSGCASSGKEDLSTQPHLSRAEAQKLYRTARDKLNEGDYEAAIQSYRKVEDNYPFTDYAVQAQLEEAYAHFRRNDPELALASANRFIKEHPRNSNVDYAYYLKGLINFKRGTEGSYNFFGVDQSRRDEQYAQQAFDDFGQLIRRFPDSKYNGDARKRMIYLRNQLARSELNVADYYMRRGAWIAANRRAQYIIRHYQGTPAVPEALMILEQSYVKLGLENPARDTRQVLVASYPEFAKKHGVRN